jgi:hypothetical protein
MRFLRGLEEITLRDRRKSEDMRNLLEVNKMTDDIKEHQGKWRSHVYQVSDYRLQRTVFNYRQRGWGVFRKLTNEMV